MSPFRFVVFALVGAIVFGFIAVLIGDSVIGSIFGIGGVLEPVDHALAVVLSVTVAAAIVATLASFTRRAFAQSTAAWTLPASIAVAVLYLASPPPLETLSILTMAALTVLVANVWIWEKRPGSTPRSEDVRPRRLD